MKNVVDPVIQRNGFYGHAENILGMVTDEWARIRQLGLRRVMKGSYRLIDLIKLQDCQATEPPVSQTSQELIGSNKTPKFNFQKCRSRTQVVKRNVKLVTESPASMCGAEVRAL